MTGHGTMEEQLQAMTMRELRDTARREGCPLGKGAGTKDAAVARIIANRRKAEAMEDYLQALEEEAGI